MSEREAELSLAHLQAVKGAENREGERGGKRGWVARWEGKRMKVGTECTCEGGVGGRSPPPTPPPQRDNKFGSAPTHEGTYISCFFVRVPVI